MLTKDEIIGILRDNFSFLSSEYGVKRLGLFGSYAQNNPTQSSDIDILVEFDRPIGFRFSTFAEYLEDLLGKKVDILTPSGVQGIRVRGIADSIQKSVVYVQ